MTKSNASLRDGPASTATHVLAVPKGATVVRLGTTSGSYAAVAYAGKRGFIDMPFLSP